MPVRISCPNCQGALSMPDAMYGKQVRCPKCQQPFVCPPGPDAAPQRSSPSPYDYDAPPRSSRGYEDYDQSERRYESEPRGSWGRFAIGSIFLFISFGLLAAGECVLHIGLLANKNVASKAVSIVFQILTIAGAATGAIGLGIAGGLPRQSRVRGILFGGMGFLISAAVLAFIVFILNLTKFVEEATNAESALTKLRLLQIMILITNITLIGGYVHTLAAAIILCTRTEAFGVASSAVGCLFLVVVSPLVQVSLEIMHLQFNPDIFTMFSASATNTLLTIRHIFALLFAVGITTWICILLGLLNSAISRARSRGVLS